MAAEELTSVNPLRHSATFAYHAVKRPTKPMLRKLRSSVAKVKAEMKAGGSA